MIIAIMPLHILVWSLDLCACVCVYVCVCVGWEMRRSFQNTWICNGLGACLSNLVSAVLGSAPVKSNTALPTEKSNLIGYFCVAKMKTVFLAGECVVCLHIQRKQCKFLKRRKREYLYCHDSTGKATNLMKV